MEKQCSTMPHNFKIFHIYYYKYLFRNICLKSMYRYKWTLSVGHGTPSFTSLQQADSPLSSDHTLPRNRGSIPQCHFPSEHLLDLLTLLFPLGSGNSLPYFSYPPSAFLLLSFLFLSFVFLCFSYFIN